MSTKLLWIGLTMIVALPLILPMLPWTIAGAIFMGIGCVMLVLDRRLFNFRKWVNHYG